MRQDRVSSLLPLKTWGNATGGIAPWLASAPTPFPACRHLINLRWYHGAKPASGEQIGNRSQSVVPNSCCRRDVELCSTGDWQAQHLELRLRFHHQRSGNVGNPARVKPRDPRRSVDSSGAPSARWMLSPMAGWYSAMREEDLRALWSLKARRLSALGVACEATSHVTQSIRPKQMPQIRSIEALTLGYHIRA